MLCWHQIDLQTAKDCLAAIGLLMRYHCAGPPEGASVDAAKLAAACLHGQEGPFSCTRQHADIGTAPPAGCFALPQAHHVGHRYTVMVNGLGRGDHLSLLECNFKVLKHSHLS